jgi:hypothetical protein
VAGVFLLACIGVGLFVFSRERDKPPVRFRSAVTIQIAPQAQAPAKGNTATTSAPVIVTAGPAKLATSAATRTAALRGAHVAPTARAIGFSANVLRGDQFIVLTVTAPTRVLASSVATSWGKTFSAARRLTAQQQLQAQQRQLVKQNKLLHQELQSVDVRLAKLMPGIYSGIFRFDNAFGTSSRKGGSSSSNAAEVPRVPDGASIYATNLVFERPQLLAQISDISDKTAKLTLTGVTPDAFAKVLSQTPPRLATKTRSVTVPAAGGLLGGLALGVGAAVAMDRRDRRIRDPRSAASAFAAPVLSLIPSTTDGDYIFLSDPYSNVAEAYRGLAATSIATDRLPKAIMVSTPHGDAHDEVAANYAAALSRFGLKVALIATTPEQAWYARRFVSVPPALPEDSSDGTLAGHIPSDHSGATFPELLASAHAGTLNGHLGDRLASDERAPNLVVVPPSEETSVQLPVDGLPLLLQALADAGIDVTIISGPALLEDADATIVAWATRCVLWAIVSGEITSTEARAAAARLELAGVVPFGVVMVGHRLHGI